jgi:GxxExxY protein
MTIGRSASATIEASTSSGWHRMSGRIQPDYTHRVLTGKIIGACYRVYFELGYGFLESVEKAVALVLVEQGIQTERQVPISVWFQGEVVGKFRPDLLIERSVILELKAARTIEASHEAQLLNALRATSIEIGLLFNFGPRAQLRRMAFSNTRKTICVDLRSSAAESGRRSEPS